MAQGKRFVPTRPMREQVQQLKADGWSNDRIARLLGISRNTLESRFAEELDCGADIEEAQRLAWARKAAKKGNMTAIKWLDERQALARAAQQIDGRGDQTPPIEPTTKMLPKGKKDQLQSDAEAVTGLYAAPQGPQAKPH